MPRFPYEAKCDGLGVNNGSVRMGPFSWRVGNETSGLNDRPHSLLSQPTKLPGSIGRPQRLVASLSWGS